MAAAVDRPLELRLAVTAEPGAEPEERERLGAQLGRELRELDVDAVTAVDGGPAPAGSKGTVASVGELLVTMSGAGGVFATVVATVRDWLQRRSDGSRVTLTIDGDSLELSSATAAERSALIATFVHSHSGG